MGGHAEKIADYNKRYRIGEKAGWMVIFKGKNPLTALVLALGMPGLGQIYLGKGEEGLFYYLFPNTLVLVCFLFTDGGWILVSLAVLFGFYFYAALKAYFDAKHGRFPGHPRAYNRSSVYLGLWLTGLCFPLFLTNPDSALGRHVAIRGFRARVPSMEPTLLKDDLFFIRMKKEQGLRRGHVVVLADPFAPHLHHIRRVVALAGDRVEIRGGHIILNGVPALKIDLSEDLLTERWTPSAAVQAEDGVRVCLETLSGITYPVLESAGRTQPDWGPQTLAQGRVFVMADFRFRFADSITWGPVDERDILGGVDLILWSSQGRNRLRKLNPKGWARPRAEGH